MVAHSKLKTASPLRTIAFQGQPGAYSHLACRRYFSEMTPLPTPAFEDTFAAVQGGHAKLAMIPIENSVAGRVADIHRIMPNSGLYIIGERFLRVNHHLLAPKGATMKSIRRVHSHVHALGQCRNFLRKHGLEAVVHADTAGAAADIGANGDKSEAAIASELAGEVYGLKSVRASIEDAGHNTTRFVVMSKKPVRPNRNDGVLVTSFVFRVRNVPAALFKALGGFATNGVNMTKLESYMVGGDFFATQFYADVEGDPRDRNVKLAFEELDFYTHEVKILGTYPADPLRLGKG
ncbi:MAG: P-protein [Alphaproteobacteria bacterium MarineAlpha11_Bin1]|nr:MAG: P-protein [Alphaproteobacteria bacterium MarineAlpha11_Bin1]|tara:strand:- start:1544 stop:2419 length:876 start_codon:yes stop_codon:yes gene_type:complete